MSSNSDAQYKRKRLGKYKSPKASKRLPKHDFMNEPWWRDNDPNKRSFVSATARAGGFGFGRSSRNLLHLACYRNNLEAVQYVLNRDSTDLDRLTSLKTLRNNYFTYMDVLENRIRVTSNKDALTDHKATILGWCAYLGHHDIMEELLKRGAKVHVRMTGGSEVPCMIRSLRAKEIIERVCKYELLCFGTPFGITPLHTAMRHRNMELVDAYLDDLEKSNSIDTPLPLPNEIAHTGKRMNALCIAAQFDANCVDHVLARRADVNMVDNLHIPLAIAVEANNIGVVQRLLAAGAVVDARLSEKHRTPLHLSLQDRPLVDIANCLLDAGADANLVFGPDSNSTLLTLVRAIQSYYTKDWREGWLQIMTLLRRLCAVTEVRADALQVFMKSCDRADHKSIVSLMNLLLEFGKLPVGAFPDMLQWAQSPYYEILWCTARTRNCELVQNLLQSGIPSTLLFIAPNDEDSTMETILEKCIGEKMFHMVQFMFEIARNTNQLHLLSDKLLYCACGDVRMMKLVLQQCAHKKEALLSYESACSLLDVCIKSDAFDCVVLLLNDGVSPNAVSDANIPFRIVKLLFCAGYWPKSLIGTQLPNLHHLTRSRSLCTAWRVMQRVVLLHPTYRMDFYSIAMISLLVFESEHEVLCYRSYLTTERPQVLWQLSLADMLSLAQIALRTREQGALSERCNEELVAWLRDEHKIWVDDTPNMTKMHYHASVGLEDEMIKCIGRGDDIDAEDAKRRTPFMLAVLNSQLNCASVLIERGTTIHVLDIDANTPLMIAAKLHDCEMIKLLVEHKARLDTTCASPSLIELAAPNVECMRLLNSYGPLDIDQYAAARTVVGLYNGDHLEATAVLLDAMKASAVLHPGNFKRSMPLLSAVAEKRVDFVDLFLSMGAYVQIGCLLACVKSRDKDMFIKLMEHVDDLDSERYAYALYTAIEYGEAEFVELLVKYAVAVFERENNGIPTWPVEGVVKSRLAPALHMACARMRLDMVSTLLDAGANVNSRDMHDKTALHYACECYNFNEANGEAMVKLLFEQSSIDVCAVDNMGQTALHSALTLNRVESSVLVLPLLLAHGAVKCVNMKDKKGRTPMQLLFDQTKSYISKKQTMSMYAKLMWTLYEHGAELREDILSLCMGCVSIGDVRALIDKGACLLPTRPIVISTSTFRRSKRNLKKRTDREMTKTAVDKDGTGNESKRTQTEQYLLSIYLKCYNKEDFESNAEDHSYVIRKFAALKHINAPGIIEAFKKQCVDLIELLLENGTMTTPMWPLAWLAYRCCFECLPRVQALCLARKMMRAGVAITGDQRKRGAPLTALSGSDTNEVLRQIVGSSGMCTVMLRMPDYEQHLMDRHMSLARLLCSARRVVLALPPHVRACTRVVEHMTHVTFEMEHPFLHYFMGCRPSHVLVEWLPSADDVASIVSFVLRGAVLHACVNGDGLQWKSHFVKELGVPEHHKEESK